MSSERSGCERFIYSIVSFVLCILVYSSGIGIAVGQKKPTSLKFDVDTDDSQICDAQGKGNLNGSRFCALYRSYYSNLNSKNVTAAQADRNEMIDIVRGQVDIFYKLRKDGRSTKIRLYETILDFLRIGGELAVTVMNGERAKTIVGAALSSVDIGRQSYDKNFQVLQTQVLINKMNSKRADILTEIVRSMDKPVGADKPSDTYSWYQAKNDLRRYLLAGTFDDALDSLVKESGAEVVKAEDTLKTVSKKDVDAAGEANTYIMNFRKALADAVTKDAATNALRRIVARLNAITDIKPRLEAETLTTLSEGEKILNALIKIRRDFAVEDRDDLVIKINEIIRAEGGTLE